MNRIAYFGTNGNNEPGHYFRAIEGNFSSEEQGLVEFLDGGSLDFDRMIYDGSLGFKFFRYLNYFGLASPVSPDDERGGSKTIVLIENVKLKNDILEAIEAHPFLKGQFNRICAKYKVNLPKIEES